MYIFHNVKQILYQAGLHVTIKLFKEIRKFLSAVQLSLLCLLKHNGLAWFITTRAIVFNVRQVHTDIPKASVL
jgi:hypothetical protein